MVFVTEETLLLSSSINASLASSGALNLTTLVPVKYQHSLEPISLAHAVDFTAASRMEVYSLLEVADIIVKLLMPRNVTKEFCST